MQHACRHGTDVKSAYKIIVGKPNRRDHVEDLRMDGKVILKWFLEL